MDTPFSIRSQVLRVLADGPGYGADISQRIALRSGGKTILSPGALYPAIKSLLEDGLIASVQDSEPGAKPDRRRASFRLTAVGLQRVHELQVETHRFWGGELPIKGD